MPLRQWLQHSGFLEKIQGVGSTSHVSKEPITAMEVGVWRNEKLGREHLKALGTGSNTKRG
jgi:hypothetical protein